MVGAYELITPSPNEHTLQHQVFTWEKPHSIETTAKVIMTIITVTKSPIRGIDAVTTMEADMVIVLAPGPIHHGVTDSSEMISFVGYPSGTWCCKMYYS